MTEFKVKIKANQQALQMMQGDSEMMNMMMQGSAMRMSNNDMMKGRNITEEMMQNIMKDGKMMNKMMQMMNKDGFMSDECLKSNMRMMNDKGMQMMNNE
ncbi:hypothetical protein CXF67_09730 [Psychroflexus sp. MES1-P1E]|nr:hypothetical protein CXF67_09730 [Psychroflexus sp. MES1-P1E]